MHWVSIDQSGYSQFPFLHTNTWLPTIVYYCTFKRCNLEKLHLFHPKNENCTFQNCTFSTSRANMEHITSNLVQNEAELPYCSDIISKGPITLRIVYQRISVPLSPPCLPNGWKQRGGGKAHRSWKSSRYKQIPWKFFGLRRWFQIGWKQRGGGGSGG